jgi:hypothetical protein
MDLTPRSSYNPYKTWCWRSARIMGRALLPGRFHTARARHVRIPHARARGDSLHSDFTWHACPDHEEFRYGSVVLDIDNCSGF